MTDIAERYDRLAGDFAATVAAVDDDQWASSSPCEGWTARDVVAHVVDVHGMFLGLVGRELWDIPSLDDNPFAAFAAARAAVAVDLADPQRAAATYDGFLGRSTFAEAIDRFLVGDLLVHRWDLARATGGEERLEPADVRRAYETALSFADALRTPGAFGPEIEPPAEADEQTRLLAFLGRRSW